MFSEATLSEVRPASPAHPDNGDVQLIIGARAPPGGTGVARHPKD